jgi:hypothetical protein
MGFVVLLTSDTLKLTLVGMISDSSESRVELLMHVRSLLTKGSIHSHRHKFDVYYRPGKNWLQSAMKFSSDFAFDFSRATGA